MKLRSRNKRNLFSAKQEASAIDFIFNTEITLPTDKKNNPKCRLSNLNLKTEDLSNKDNFIGKVENNQPQAISTLKRTSQINKVAVQNVEYIKAEIKQEYVAKPEALLTNVSGNTLAIEQDIY